MNHTTWLGCAMVVLLAACVSPMQQADDGAQRQNAAVAVKEKVSVPFDENQAKAAMVKGSSRIKGVLYHRVTMNGRYAGGDYILSAEPAVHLKGVTVMLFPETEHLKEWLKLERENRGKRLSSTKNQLVEYIPDSRMWKYAIKTKTDQHGRYFFNNLKPGKYFVLADDVEVNSTGYSVVQDGVSVITSGYFTSQASHYRTQNHGVVTVVQYGSFHEIKPDQNELVVESRMRQDNFINRLWGF